MELRKLEGTPILEISSQLKSQIDYLHNQIGGKEWSGPLIYTIHGGDLEKPDELVITADEVYLMDIGTSGGTDFEMTPEETVKMYDRYEGLNTGQQRIGLIHSHHNMKTFFSGTDNDELQENAEDYNAYLSLIVGTKAHPVARVAFITEIEKQINSTYKYKNMQGDEFTGAKSEVETEKVVCMYDCEVVVPMNVSQSFIDRYDEVQEANKPKYNYQNKGGYGGYGGYNRKKTTGLGKDKKNHGGNGTNQLRLLSDPQSDEGEYSLKEVETFLCKLATTNPDSKAINLWSVLNSVSNQQFDRSTEDIINAIDDCMKSVMGEEGYKQSTTRDKLIMLEEALMYLQESDAKNKSLSEKFELADTISNAIASILVVNTKPEIEEYNEVTGFQGSF